LGEQFLPVAQSQQDATLSLMVHTVMGDTLLWLGEFASAQAHLDHAIAFYDSEYHRDLAYHLGQDPGLAALGFAAQTLWFRGYPDQALERTRHVLSLAQALSHPLSLTDALGHVAFVHLFRREGQEAHARAEALLNLAHEYGFALWLGIGMSLQGWALVERDVLSDAREQGKAGLAQLREGLTAMRAMGAEISVPLYLGALAQGYGQGGQAEEGLRVIAEALAMVEKNEEHWSEAELYRLKGELTLHKSRVGGAHHAGTVTEAGTVGRAHPTATAKDEAEVCFLKAIAIAQKQQAKSLELRATVSLARLWQQQGKRAEAHHMLSEIYNWFTEGFYTKDLQEAKGLLDELA
jgi:predicted ATPase